MAEQLKRWRRRWPLWVGMVLFYALPLVAVNGAFDVFLKIDGVDGESADINHQKWIDATSFSHVIKSSASVVGGSGTAGNLQIQDLVVGKMLDKASPQLFLMCCNGTHINSVILDVVNQQSGFSFYTITLQDVLVSSVQSSGLSSGGDARPTESITFNFGKIEWKYQPSNASGGSNGPPVITTWDLVLNKAASVTNQ